MPYHCARAVCATFCYKIAGALIPIFGPVFPAMCVRPDSPEYGRMTINPRIIADAAREAELNRRHYLSLHSPRGTLSGSNSPRSARTPARSTPEGDLYGSSHHQRQPYNRLRLKPRALCDSPYNTDPEEGYHRSVPDSASSSSSSTTSSAYFYTPTGPTAMQTRSSGWTPANRPPPQVPTPHHREDQYSPSNPWLSAVPRFAPPNPVQQAPPHLRPWLSEGSGADGDSSSASSGASNGSNSSSIGKRPMESEANSNGYDAGGESLAKSPALARGLRGGAPVKVGAGAQVLGAAGPRGLVRRPADGVEKNAALLLMNLSVRDGGGMEECAERAVEELHRAKRRRASSM